MAETRSRKWIAGVGAALCTALGAGGGQLARQVISPAVAQERSAVGPATAEQVEKLDKKLDRLAEQIGARLQVLEVWKLETAAVEKYRKEHGR